MFIPIVSTIVLLLLLVYFQLCRLDLNVEEALFQQAHPHQLINHQKKQHRQHFLKSIQFLPTILITLVWLFTTTTINYFGLTLSLIINAVLLIYGYHWFEHLTYKLALRKK